MPARASSADHVSDDRRLPIPRQLETDPGACDNVCLDITDGPRWDAGREAPARWRPYRADIDVLIDGDHGSKQPHHSVASGRECYPAVPDGRIRPQTCRHYCACAHAYTSLSRFVQTPSAHTVTVTAPDAAVTRRLIRQSGVVSAVPAGAVPR